MNNLIFALRKIANTLFCRKPTVSFCITCRNRMWQIEQTLARNLKDNYALRDRVEFVLVDFASTDGLQEWVRENFQDELSSGYLKYYYSEGMPIWHMAVAKNTAHRLGGNEVLVNLDCDNFTGPKGANYVAHRLRKYGIDNAVLQMWGGDWDDGTFGRVVLSKKNFTALGGYDESLEPFGGDDNDLVTRAKAYGIKRLNGKGIKYMRAICNERGLGLEGHAGRQELHEMNERNKAHSKENIAAGRLVANTDKEMIGVSAVRMFHE